MATLDVPFVRQHFPAFTGDSPVGGRFFDSAAGSFPCRETIDALNEFYLCYKLQPGNEFAESQEGWARMMASQSRWAEALGVQRHELGFGPSTSQNTYVLAQAFAEMLASGDQVIVTNQDHEANSGAIRRAVIRAGAEIVEWKVDPVTGLLDPGQLESLLSERTRLVCFPHSSNITGEKNDAERIIELARQVSAYTLVDGVSYVPHDIPDVGALGADVYIFSLYKVFSVHLGVLVVREALLERLPQQGHYFKLGLDVNERLVPAGPDHAQVAASGAVLDYVETLAVHHGGSVSDLRTACQFVSGLWYEHEQTLVKPLLEFFSRHNRVRLLGSSQPEQHCPLFAIAPLEDTAANLAHILCDQGMLVSAGHFYAPRLLEAVNIDPDAGVVRMSLAHYNDVADVDALIARLTPLLN